MSISRLPSDPGLALSRVLDDFERRQDSDSNSVLTSFVYDNGHAHVYRRRFSEDGAYSGAPLYAVAVPDQNLAARIAITGVCPICEPIRYAAGSPAAADRYTVEHTLTEVTR